MSDNDLIRRGDALECFMGYDRTGDIKDAIAALPAVTVRVKPLVWRDDFMRWSGNSFTSTAVGAGHTYIIAASLDDPEADNVIAAKKAAAQADYEARIRAALEPVAAPDPAAIREAALFEAWNAVWEAKSLLDAKNALHALISKGGDAYAVDPRHAPHEASPGVTAGADAARAVADYIARQKAISPQERAEIDAMVAEVMPVAQALSERALDAAQAREAAARLLLDMLYMRNNAHEGVSKENAQAMWDAASTREGYAAVDAFLRSIISEART